MKFKITNLLSVVDSETEEIKPVEEWTAQDYETAREQAIQQVDAGIRVPFTHDWTHLDPSGETSAQSTVFIDVMTLDVMDAIGLSKFSASAIRGTDIVSPTDELWDDTGLTIEGNYYDDNRPREELELDVLNACGIEPVEPPQLVFKEEESGWSSFYVEFDLIALFDEFGSKEFACSSIVSRDAVLGVEFEGY